MSALQRGKEPSVIVRQRIVSAVGPAVASVVVLGTAGCAGDTEAAPEPVGAESTTPSGTGSSVVSPTPTPSPTRTPSPTARPLSRFEDEPQVVATRAWAAAMAEAVNEKDRRLAGAARHMTDQGRERFSGYAQEDIGLHYPGPMPFTPTDVTVNGRRAEVAVCWWGYGFALDPETKRPVDERTIEPATVFLKKQGGRWKVDDLLTAQGDCSKVSVKGVGW